MKPNRGGIFSLIKSFRYAFRGLFVCVKTERNMRVHIFAAAVVTYFGAVIGLSRGEWSILVLLFGAMFAAEGFNTAVEALGDGQTKEYSKHIEIAKDAAAGAVLALAIAAVSVGAFIFIKAENLAKLSEAVYNLPLISGFTALLISGTCFVFIGIPSIKKGKNHEKI